MLVGDLILRMNSDPYFGPPMARSTCKAIFTAQVTNIAGAPSLNVVIQHRNRDDTAWAVAGTIAGIIANGVYSATIANLNELIRYQYVFTAGAATDGFYVFAGNPQWLND